MQRIALGGPFAAAFEPLVRPHLGASETVVQPRLMPDLHIEMRRYRARGNIVFVVAANRGTIRGTSVAWGAVYRVHLRDGLVHRGRRFYDQATVFRALLPTWAGCPSCRTRPATRQAATLSS